MSLAGRASALRLASARQPLPRRLEQIAGTLRQGGSLWWYRQAVALRVAPPAR